MIKKAFFLTLILGGFFSFNLTSASTLNLIAGSDQSVADSYFFNGTIHEGAFSYQRYDYFYLNDFYNIKAVRFSAYQPASYGATGDFTIHIGQGSDYNNITELGSQVFDYHDLTSDFQNYIANFDIHINSTSTPLWIWLTTSGYGSPNFGQDTYSPTDLGFSSWTYGSQYNNWTQQSPSYPDFGIYAVSDSNINISYPVSGSVDLKQFNYFTGRYNNNYSDGQVSVIIKYGLDQNLLNSQVGKYNFSTIIAGGTASEDNYQVESPALDPAKKYFAQAFLIDYATGKNIATSTIISFTMSTDLSGSVIDSGLAVSEPLATTTASSTPSVLAGSCDASSGLISYSSCVMFSWLFSPATTTLNKWTALKDELSTKPPFGYSAYITALNKITEATTTEATNAFADLTSLSSVFFDNLKVILSLILWVSFAFHLFRRLKSIEL